MKWTASSVAELGDLWGEGLSASEIAERMGLTKGAIIGKADRLNLPRRPSPIRKRTSNVVPLNPHLPATELPHEPTGCRWIEGDVLAGPWRYCQAHQKAKSSYCNHHHQRCYRRVSEVEHEVAQ